MENTAEKQVGWSVKLTKEWPYIMFNAFADKQPTINKKPIPLAKEIGKISETPKPTVLKPKAKTETPSPSPAPQQPTPEPAPQQEIKLIAYSEKAIVVIGDTKHLKDLLKQAGGKWNPNLKINDEPIKGWIFSKRRTDEVKQIIAS